MTCHAEQVARKAEEAREAAARTPEGRQQERDKRREQKRRQALKDAEQVARAAQRVALKEAREAARRGLKALEAGSAPALAEPGAPVLGATDDGLPPWEASTGEDSPW